MPADIDIRTLQARLADLEKRFAALLVIAATKGWTGLP